MRARMARELVDEVGLFFVFVVVLERGGFVVDFF